MTLTAEMLDFCWTGAFIAIKVLGLTFLWCVVAGVVNKSISG